MDNMCILKANIVAIFGNIRLEVLRDPGVSRLVLPTYSDYGKHRYNFKAKMVSVFVDLYKVI